MRTLSEGDFKNKKTLVRVDFNVALGPKGEVVDDFRIVKTLPTIKFLAESGAIVVLMSHLETEDGPASLRPVSRRLAELLGRPVKFLSDCVGEKTREEISRAGAGEIILLENLRFHEGEKRNDAEFAAELAKNGDCYVNEAFSCCHRAHASIAGVPRLLPSYGGMLLAEEIGSLRKVIKNPARPLVAIIGGVKMDTKAKVIAAIAAIADHVLIGSKIGAEILAHKQQIAGREIFKFDSQATEIDLTSPKIHLPIDAVMALKDASEGYSRIAGPGMMRGEENIYDIGPETAKFFAEIIKDAKTIFFNGPMGWFERQEFSGGTRAVIEAISRTHGAWRAAGGGQTLEAIAKFKAEENFNFLSTGGGAMLEYLAGNVLPGIAALENLPSGKNETPVIPMPLPAGGLSGDKKKNGRNEN